MGNQNTSECLFHAINESNDIKSLDLMSEGININSLSNCGVSVLRGALEKGLPNLFRFCYLQNAKMQPSLSLNQTALHRAVCLGHFSLAVVLLKDAHLFRHKINEEDSLGRTALHLSVEADNPDMVSLLLKYNANKYIKDYQQKTPYDLALTSTSPNAHEIIEQLTIEDKLEKKSLTQNSYESEKTFTDSLKIYQDIQRIDKSYDFFSILENVLQKNCIPIIDKKDLRIYEIINKGSSCLVFKGIWKDCEVAVKQFTNEYTKSVKKIKKIIKEIVVMSQVNHKNLLLMLGVCMHDQRLSIITELMPNQSLFDAIHNKNAKKLSLKEKFHVSIQIAEGLAYLHKKNPPIIHRDLKPENCLLDFELNLKICDFGLARSLKKHNDEATTICIGTTRFMAPELFDKEKNKKIGIESDIWAYGCLLIEIFSGKRPWHYISSKKSTNIFYELYNKRPIPIPDNVPPEISKLIKECCQYNIRSRPYIENILLSLKNVTNFYLTR